MSENKSYSYQIQFPLLKHHPQGEAALFILKRLQAQGYESLLAGGAVRDFMLNRQPTDLDIATNATPDEVENLFDQTVAVGKAFGVIRVLIDGYSIEVATYRQDLNYQDGRRPESVLFTNRVEDAKRRDFTINALFYDPLTETLYDDVEGKKDLDQKILRSVGLAEERFEEDQLRRLRLVRFVSQLGFKVEARTQQALTHGIEGIQKVSRERITEEIGKMWQGHFLEKAFLLFIDSKLAEQIDHSWQRYQPILPENKIWTWPRKNLNEAWVHYFSFFFFEKSFKIHFRNYKLSRNLEKYIDSVHQAYLSAADFFKMSKGQQRLCVEDKSFILGITYYLEKNNLSENPDMKLVLEKIENQLPLPPALIKAHHLQPQFAGPELGQALQALYIQQLEHDWTHVDQALDWLNKNPLAIKR